MTARGQTNQAADTATETSRRTRGQWSRSLAVATGSAVSIAHGDTALYMDTTQAY